MADNAESSNDAQITFKVKTSSDSTHSITMSESATVLDLKTKMAGEDYENIPIDRQRLIYSGRVMKNDDALSAYKIKPNNTIHMVKSAASNPRQPPASSSAAAPQAVPTNMASGTANNPLAGLTGARYAGHQINLPGMDMFGPDGGMGPPMDEERIQRMMSDPNVQQTMNEALNSPDFVNFLIESNPMLRNMPNAREIISSPFMRQMMTNPQMMGQAMRMQRNMRGGDAAFPAPGATDTTPDDAAASAGQPNANPSAPSPPNPFMNPFMNPGMLEGGNQMNFAQMLAAMNGGAQANAAGTTGTMAEPGTNQTQGATGQATTGSEGAAQTGQSPPPANPFAALFAPPQGGNAAANSPFPMNPDAMAQMLQLLGGGAPGAGAAAAPPDDRPPEVRYEEQLRQLNDMGFYDFDRNVAALRRSGGSVQGAVEHLLSSI